jgi:hypothetical protein
MSLMTLVTWHRSELTEEFGKLRRDLSPSLLNSLVLAGLVPAEETQGVASRFSALAIVPILQAQASSQPFEDERLPREARPFLELHRGVRAAATLCIQRVEQTLVRCASLGTLASMLRQWDAATLESLRGDARLEWRLTQLLDWLRTEADSALPMAAPAAKVPAVASLSGAGWSVPSVPALSPVYGASGPARPAAAVSASFAERLARISAAVGKPLPVSPVPAQQPAAEPAAFSAPSLQPAVPQPRPAAPIPRPLPKRQPVERAVSDEVDWGFEQVAPSSSPAGVAVAAPSEVLGSAVVASERVAPSWPALVAQSAPDPVAPSSPALLAQESSGLHSSIISDAGPTEAVSLATTELSDALGTAISLALASSSSEAPTVGSPAFEISGALFDASEPQAPSVAAHQASSADVTESVWSESNIDVGQQEPARWELAVDAIRRLAQSGEAGQLSPYAEAMAANAVEACLACEVYEVEPDLLQFADDALLPLAELVWAELEPELSNSDRAELAVRFAERLSRRRTADGRVLLRKQLVGVCRIVLRDPALAYDLLTDRFTSVDLTAEECDLVMELADETANQVSWSELLERSSMERPELATLFSGYRLEAMERVGDLTGVADALERTLTETSDTLTYLALLRRAMALVENDLGDLHRAAELARNAIASGRFDDQLLGETDRLFAEAWRFEELGDLLLNAVSSEPAGSLRLTAVLRRLYYLARDHFADALQASRTMVELLVDPRHDAGLMLSKVVLPTDYDAARREAEALREFALVRPDDDVTPAVRIRASYLFALVLNDDDSGAEQLMAALPRLGDDPALIIAAEQVMFALTRSAEYGADAVGWLLARAHACPDRAAALGQLVALMQLPVEAAISDEARAEISEDAIALADSPELPASDRAAAHLAVARLKRGAGALRTAAFHAVQAAEQAAEDEVDELLFADALAELGDLGGSSLRAWGGDEVSARALFSNNLTVLLSFGRLCSQAGAWPQAVRAFERAVPLLRATDDAAGLAEVEQQLDAARQQLPQ